MPAIIEQDANAFFADECDRAFAVIRMMNFLTDLKLVHKRLLLSGAKKTEAPACRQAGK
jgi:hypothetical protein